jgi:DNA polymerase III gamma/tau subunit
MEVNAADIRGIDSIRSIIGKMMYSPTYLPKRVIILDECFPGETLVMVDYDKALPISEIVNNTSIDSVLSYDLEGKSIKQSKILNRYKRIYSDKKVKVGFSDGTWVKSTRQHKYYVVGKGYTPAQDLNPGDKLIEYSGNFSIRKYCDICKIFINEKTLSAHLMRYHRETTSHIDYSNSRVGEKRADTVIEKVKTGFRKFLETNAGKEFKLRLSIKQRGKNNTIFRYKTPSEVSTFSSRISKEYWDGLPQDVKDEKIKKLINYPKYNNTPNKVERKVIEWNLKGLKYVGDGSLFVTLSLPSGKKIRKNPDFIYKEKNKITKIIEIMDFEYWHSKEEASYIEAAYKKLGYKCLIIDAKRFNNDIEALRGEIECYINNHYREISFVEMKNYVRPQDVYDLEVEGNHNFFVVPANYKKSGFVEKLGHPILVSNCHSLTNDAQNCLLKPLEEPPIDNYLILCTTEPDKLLKTVRNRCDKHELSSLSSSERTKLIRNILHKENVTLSEDTIKTFAQDCSSSPRDLLNQLDSLLAQNEPDSPETVMAVLNIFDEDLIDSTAISMARALAYKPGEVKNLAKNLEPGMNYEGYRRLILSYIKKCLLSAKDSKSEERFIKIIELFMSPLEYSAADLDFICRLYKLSK